MLFPPRDTGIVWGRYGRAAGFFRGRRRLCCPCCEKARVMAGRINWKRLGNRDRMRRQGVEDVKSKTPVINPAEKPGRQLTKAELREQAEAAVLAWHAGQASKDTSSNSRRNEPCKYQASV